MDMGHHFWSVFCSYHHRIYWGWLTNDVFAPSELLAPDLTKTSSSLLFSFGHFWHPTRNHIDTESVTQLSSTSPPRQKRKQMMLPYVILWMMHFKVTISESFWLYPWEPRRVQSVNSVTMSSVFWWPLSIKTAFIESFWLQSKAALSQQCYNKVRR